MKCPMELAREFFGAGRRSASMTLSCAARHAPIVLKCMAMSTASARPQLQIRQAQEDDASPLCEIFNEAVQDRLETFDSEPRAVDDQRLRYFSTDEISSPPT